MNKTILHSNSGDGLHTFLLAEYGQAYEYSEESKELCYFGNGVDTVHIPNATQLFEQLKSIAEHQMLERAYYASVMKRSANEEIARVAVETIDRVTMRETTAKTTDSGEHDGVDWNELFSDPIKRGEYMDRVVTEAIRELAK